MSTELTDLVLQQKILEELFAGLNDDDEEPHPKTVCELRDYIHKNFNIKDESLKILGLNISDNSKILKLNINVDDYKFLQATQQLSIINSLGLIPFESQLVEISKIYTDGYIYRYRSYLNGLFPRKFVAKLATQLYKINDKIVVSETVLHPDHKDYDPKDHLNLYNYNRDGIPLKDGLYPMSLVTSLNHSTQWYSDRSGNVKYPMTREYITDYFFYFSPELTNEIVGTHSLIQIWSTNISDNIFPTIVSALYALL